MGLRTPLAKARGLGSAHAGLRHWWIQRITAVFVGLLTIWFVLSLVAHVGQSHASVVEWLSSPLQAALMVVYLACIFYHSQLGLEVIIRDYLHCKYLKFSALVGTLVANVLLASLAIMSVLKLTLGAA